MHIQKRLKHKHMITIGITLFFFLQKNKCSGGSLHQVTVEDNSCMHLLLL